MARDVWDRSSMTAALRQGELQLIGLRAGDAYSLGNTHGVDFDSGIVLRSGETGLERAGARQGGAGCIEGRCRVDGQMRHGFVKSEWGRNLICRDEQCEACTLCDAGSGSGTQIPYEVCPDACKRARKDALDCADRAYHILRYTGDHAAARRLYIKCRELAAGYRQCVYNAVAAARTPEGRQRIREQCPPVNIAFPHATIAECCIRLICRDVEKVPLPGVHCGIEKISCNGDRVVYELLTDPPKAKDVRQQGGSGSQVYAIRDPNYAAGTDTRYSIEFSVCYPCDNDRSDPIACNCVVDGVGRPNDVGTYPWRDSSNYNPGGVGDLPMQMMKPIADAIAGQLFHPNSNSFAKYYMHRCTKKGHRPKMPKSAWGWGFDYGGKGPDHPPPWGGVS